MAGHTQCPTRSHKASIATTREELDIAAAATNSVTKPAMPYNIDMITPALTTPSF
jgi:hypothetical protein